MEKFVQNLNESIAKEMKNIEDVFETSILVAQEATKVYGNGMAQLRTFISTYSFKNNKEEIHFFKHLKPTIQSQLIYYSQICDIESRRPIGSIPVIKQYLIDELNHLNHFFDKNAVIYQYFRLNKMNYDTHFFLRHQMIDDAVISEDLIYGKDPYFTTPCDFKIAKIMANQELFIYLNNEYVKLDHPELANVSNFKKSSWTGKKIWMIELAYSLYCSGVVNHGNASIIEIVGILEQAFNISLSNCYGMFSDIRKRKKNQTVFIDILKEQVIRRIDEPLELPIKFPN